MMEWLLVVATGLVTVIHIALLLRESKQPRRQGFEIRHDD